MNRIAGIWARVSGPEQQSLPSQVAEVKEWLESQGYTVPPEHVLMIDWTSTDILRCPPMRVLLGWVANHEVDGVGSVHLDRFAARPGQVAQILDTFRQSGVQLLLKHTPLPSGLMGELMGLIITIGKALSVERADQGAKKGLHDRPKLHRVPVTYRKPYGYNWSVSPLRLMPDENWDIVSFICRAGFDGIPSRAICRKLKESSIVSPAGNPEWCIQTVCDILKNPLYGGRFHALRREAREPLKRIGETYGKSSSQRLPYEKWEYLPEVEVVNPPLTWEQWLAVQKRLKDNQLLAQRNATHDYLLRGIVICDAHNRRYRGWPYHESYRYVCPIKGPHGYYFHGYFNGPQLEETAKNVAANQVSIEAIWAKPESDTTKESLLKELNQLEVTEKRTVNEIVELERRSLVQLDNEIYQISPDIYQRLKTQFEAKLQWVAERRSHLRSELNNLRRKADAIAKLQSISERVEGRLQSFNNNDWRQLFLDLGMTLHVNEDGLIEAYFDLQLGPQKIGDIVSGNS